MSEIYITGHVANKPSRGLDDCDDPLVITSLPNILNDLEFRFNPQWSQLVLTINDIKPSEWNSQMMEVGEYNDTVIVFDRQGFKEGCFIMVFNPGNPTYSLYPNSEGMMRDYGVVPESSTDVLVHGYLETAEKRARYTHKLIPTTDRTNTQSEVEIDCQMRKARHVLQMIDRLMDKATLMPNDSKFMHQEPDSIGFHTKQARDEHLTDKWDQFNWKDKF